MAAPAKTEATVNRDLLVAAAMVATGAAFCLALWDYVPKARIFPLGLAFMMILSGAGLAFSALKSRRALRRDPAVQPTRSEDDAAAAKAARTGLRTGAIPLAVVLFVWTLAVSLGAGYLLPSIPMLLAALWIAGLRRPRSLAVAAPAIALAVFTLFYIIFQTRLPELDLVRGLVAPLRRLL